MTHTHEPKHTILQLIAERDDARAAADQLAAALAHLAGVDIGEHTDTNDPWQNALDAADRLRGRVQAVDRAAQLRDEMERKYTIPTAEPGHVQVPLRIYEDIADRMPPGVPPAAKCTCDVPNEPQFPHRAWCDLMHDCPGVTCTVCSPPADLVDEFPTELGGKAPARATYAIDREDSRWNRIDSTQSWLVFAAPDDCDDPALRALLAPVPFETHDLVAAYGPLRWFDADDNEITSAGAR